MATQDESLFDGHSRRRTDGPVECLGFTFKNDDERRSHFTERLREKLGDPEFRAIEGFPIGEDEDILALSDPPYYTACPNPWLGQFVAHYGRPYAPESDDYQREPFAADVSQGKGDLLYSAHSYHTKVPPQAIAKYILHYTSPGDIVLDPFGGSGMTGLAALLCEHPSLVDADQRLAAADWGARMAVVGDLSPAATLIADVYLRPPRASEFRATAMRMLDAVVEECSEDWVVSGDTVEYFVRSEILTCPNCKADVVSNALVAMTDSIGSASVFPCPTCGAVVSKAPTKASGGLRLERLLDTDYDSVTGKVSRRRRERVVGAMRLHGGSRVFGPVSTDEANALDDSSRPCPSWFPRARLIPGDRLLLKDCCTAYGIDHIHDFYTRRQLRYQSRLWEAAFATEPTSLRRALLFFVQSYSLGATRLNRFIPARPGKDLPGSQINRYFSGTLYVPSMMSEVSPEYLYRRKIDRLARAFESIASCGSVPVAVSTQSATMIGIQDNSVDYVFVDPPFGQNLQYSELNQIWEAWLKVTTDRRPEAVVDSSRERDVIQYGLLMRRACAEMSRVLKPGRWLTMEFHNSRNAVWAAIQDALLASGLVVADVRVLDKQQDTYKQSRQGLVKQDLVISAYKPTATVERGFRLGAGTAEGAWEFIRGHLRQLPIAVQVGGVMEVLAERQAYLLYDRMVAFHVQRGVHVALSAADFYAGLEQRFSCRDGMYFLPEQVAEYDKKRMQTQEVRQLELFVIDEESAIQWLRRTLSERPMSFQDLHPLFMREIAGWEKHEKALELAEMLEENFIVYDGNGEVPSQIHAYLSSNFHEMRVLDKADAALRAKAMDRWFVPDSRKAGDLEQLRERALLKEFDEYAAGKGKLILFRIEAVRTGFRRAWQEHDYQTIIGVADRLPADVLQEDAKLLMWYDQALTRAGD